MSMPVTLAPLDAIASLSKPPPQPTSISVLPRTGLCSSIQPALEGLISWRGLNSLLASDHRDA